MNNAADNDNATSWRDLADQLTAEQVRSFDRIEARSRRRAEFAANGDQIVSELAQQLLEEARQTARANLTDTLLGIPVPDGVESADRWQDDGTGRLIRHVDGAQRSIDGANADVCIGGKQREDGSVDWHLSVYADGALNADQARALAVQLIEAADEMEQLGSSPSTAP